MRLNTVKANNLSRLLNLMRSHVLIADLTCVAILFYVSTIIWINVFPSGTIPGGVDDSSHFFKVWFLSYAWDENRMIPRWCNYWYSGYPFLVYHCPLSYFLAFTLKIILPYSLATAYQIVYLISYATLSLGCYVLTRKLGGDNIQGLLSGLAILFAPSVLENMTLVGRWPFALSMGLIPLGIIFFLNACEKNRSTLWCVLTPFVWSAVLLAHIAGFLYLAALILSFIIMNAKKRIMSNILSFVFFLTVTMMICIWWLLPLFNFYPYSHPETFGAIPPPTEIIKRAIWMPYVGLALTASVPLSIVRLTQKIEEKTKRSVLALILAFSILIGVWMLLYEIEQQSFPYAASLFKKIIISFRFLFDRACVFIELIFALLLGLSYPYVPSLLSFLKRLKAKMICKIFLSLIHI